MSNTSGQSEGPTVATSSFENLKRALCKDPAEGIRWMRSFQLPD